MPQVPEDEPRPGIADQIPMRPYAKFAQVYQEPCATAVQRLRRCDRQGRRARGSMRLQPLAPLELWRDATQY